MNVGTTILLQLGGMKFMAMTGAKRFLNLPDGTQFDLPTRVNRGINRVQVRLTAADDYTMEFGRLYGLTYKVIAKVEGVYADQLTDIFTAETGLDTHL